MKCITPDCGTSSNDNINPHLSPFRAWDCRCYCDWSPQVRSVLGNGMPSSWQKTLFVCLWHRECVAQQQSLTTWNKFLVVFLKCEIKHWSFRAGVWMLTVLESKQKSQPFFLKFGWFLIQMWHSTNFTSTCLTGSWFLITSLLFESNKLKLAKKQTNLRQKSM